MALAGAGVSIPVERRRRRSDGGESNETALGVCLTWRDRCSARAQFVGERRQRRHGGEAHDAAPIAIVIDGIGEFAQNAGAVAWIDAARRVASSCGSRAVTLAAGLAKCGERTGRRVSHRCLPSPASGPSGPSLRIRRRPLSRQGRRHAERARSRLDRRADPSAQCRLRRPRCRASASPRRRLGPRFDPAQARRRAELRGVQSQASSNSRWAHSAIERELRRLIRGHRYRDGACQRSSSAGSQYASHSAQRGISATC
jgi:hypothetical protein